MHWRVEALVPVAALVLRHLTDGAAGDVAMLLEPVDAQGVPKPPVRHVLAVAVATQCDLLGGHRLPRLVLARGNRIPAGQVGAGGAERDLLPIGARGGQPGEPYRRCQGQDEGHATKAPSLLQRASRYGILLQRLLPPDTDAARPQPLRRCEAVHGLSSINQVHTLSLRGFLPPRRCLLACLAGTEGQPRSYPKGTRPARPRLLYIRL